MSGVATVGKMVKRPNLGFVKMGLGVLAGMVLGVMLTTSRSMDGGLMKDLGGMSAKIDELTERVLAVSGEDGVESRGVIGDRSGMDACEWSEDEFKDFTTETKLYSADRIDVWMYKYLLPYLPEGTAGRKRFYVDIGANHYKSTSNTYFFDSCLGWEGICVEANPGFHEFYGQGKRSCALIPTCMADEKREVGFVFAGQIGGILETQRNSQLKGNEPTILECETGERVLSHFRRTEVDLLHIDVEGAESLVLSGFDFDKFKPYILLAESRPSAEIFTMLREHDMLLIDTKGIGRDHMWLHKELIDNLGDDTMKILERRIKY